jgi:hypothetical protein
MLTEACSDSLAMAVEVNRRYLSCHDPAPTVSNRKTCPERSATGSNGSEIANRKFPSLPLDRTRGLARDVVANAVDAFDFIADPR